MFKILNRRRPSVGVGVQPSGEEELEVETLTKFKETILGDAKYVCQ